MASPAYAEAHNTFGRYALRFVAKELAPLSAADMDELAAIVRNAEAFIADVTAQSEPQPPDVLQVLDEVRILRSRVCTVLAVAGLDASWAQNPEQIALSLEDSAFVANMLENPPEPTEALRKAAAD